MTGDKEIKVEAPVDKNGFTMKPPITDTQCILMCLRNAPCGADKKPVSYTHLTLPTILRV